MPAGILWQSKRTIIVEIINYKPQKADFSSGFLCFVYILLAEQYGIDAGNLTLTTQEKRGLSKQIDCRDDEFLADNGFVRL